MSQNPFVLFLAAIIPSSFLVCGATLLFPLTTTGMINIAQFSTHAKTLTNSPGWLPAEHRSAAHITIGTRNVSSTSAPAAILALSPSNLVEAKTVDSDASTGDRFGANFKTSGKTFKAGSAWPELESAELTPQSAETNHERLGAKRLPLAGPSPEAAQLFVTPHLKPVALGPSIKPTAPAAKPSAAAAIASPYGAKVWASLARHKPITIQRGSTTVTFAIDASGALSVVRVSQSSGNAQLDQMALQIVRSSAPFPLPPNGPSSYTIRINFQ